MGQVQTSGPTPVRLQATVERQLAARYPNVPATEVRRLVTREWAAFRAAAVQTFVPVLVERRVSHALSRRDP